jgi:hypothetical protein
MSSRLDYINQVRVNEFGQVHLHPPAQVDPREYDRLLAEAAERRREAEFKRAKQEAETAEWERQEAERLCALRKTRFVIARAEITGAINQINELKNKVDSLHHEFLKDSPAARQIDNAVRLPHHTCIVVGEWEAAISQIEALEGENFQCHHEISTNQKEKRLIEMFSRDADWSTQTPGGSA